MRKSDEKRQEILNAAERLFCSKGYEATGIQEILDAVHISKGGFYHHFISKDEVLSTLCGQRAAASAAIAEIQLQRCHTDLERLNCVLYAAMPFRKEEIDFLAMLLPILFKPEGRAIRAAYQDALVDAFAPMLDRELAFCADTGNVYLRMENAAIPLLHLINCCWYEMVKALWQSADRNDEPAGSLMEILEKYRTSIEVLLDAPFAGIQLMSLEEWNSIAVKLLQNHEVQVRFPTFGSHES